MSDHLTYHTRFTPAEFDEQYNLRAGRPDYEETVIPGWSADSEAARNMLDCSLDIHYGDGANQKLDVFRCGNASAPTLVYFHGGYWQRGGKSIYSFIATPFVAADVNVVIVGYDLCPSVTITRISQEAREAMAFIWQNASDLGINRHRITVMGHSAGGHITQMMMATDWPAFGADLPSDLIKAGIPVSPLSYLEPVRLTEALNAGIRMDPAEAEAESPMVNHPPVTNAPQLVVVGGAETDEFHRQACMYVQAYGSTKRSVGLYTVPDVDHFDELNVLVDPTSPFFNYACHMLQGKGPNL
ncbi:alpha/beta hydrolase [uncultured Ruegeria sp.]|uniref:alpha/beta hydrolase n=1 Tax=uncultured Ruegeria sp. TaxID=259304 RepID=UPI00260E11AA|nr:alpha/beta hydrolase [uncultured Ruegeria sp.]